MKKINQLIAALISIFMIISNVNIYAADNMKIIKNGSDFVLTGAFSTPNETVTLRVLPVMGNTSNPKELAAIDSMVTDKNGNFEFNFKVNGETGTYKAIVCSQTNKKEIEFYFDNSAPTQYNIYVSPTGNDNASGTEEEPLKTIIGARNRIRQLKSNFENNYIYTVYIESGEYNISDTIIFGAQDGGNEEYPVTYKADGYVTFSGGINIDKESFSISNDSRIPETAAGNVYEADISELGELDEYIRPNGALNVETSYYDVTDNGKSRTLARYPQNSFINTGEVIDSKSFNADDDTELSDVWFFGYWGNYWAAEPIKGNISGGRISLNGEPSYTLSKNMPFYMFNRLEFLDNAGEWYIDTAAKKLFYYPSDGLENIEISVLKEPVIGIYGARHMVFDGIGVLNTRDRGMVIDTKADDITILNSQFRNIGHTAIQIGSGTNIKISGCIIDSIGGRGITDSGGNRYTLTSSGNIIENCDISDFGKIYRTYAAGVTLWGVGATVRNNIIHDSPHAGIVFAGNNNRILNNEVYDCCKYTRDAGAIYAGRDWLGFGCEVSGNYIHDIKTEVPLVNEENVNAIYLDDMWSGTKVKNNIIARTGRAFLIGGGKYNHIESNTVVDCDYGMIADNRGVEGQWAYSHTLDGGQLMENYKRIVNDNRFDEDIWKNSFDNFEDMCASIESGNGGIPEGNSIKSNIFCGAHGEKYISIANEFNSCFSDNYITETSDIGFADYENDDFRINGNIPNYVSSCIENDNTMKNTYCDAVTTSDEIVIRNRTDNSVCADIYAVHRQNEIPTKTNKYLLKACENRFTALRLAEADKNSDIFVWSQMKPLYMK